MSEIEAVQGSGNDVSSELIRWVHTDIDGPCHLEVQGLNSLETGRGVAYSAELVHPKLGVLGLVANEGCGGPTTFDPSDRTKFGNDDLDAFIGRCRQDGEPIDPGFTGVEMFLEDVITESEYADLAAEVRVKGALLVRSYEPRTETNRRVSRGPAMMYSKVILRRQHREGLARLLANEPGGDLPQSAFWQMFNGQLWTPLLPTIEPDAAQRTARTKAILALHDGPTTHGGWLHNAGPLEDGMYVTSATRDEFRLVQDATNHLVKTGEWCRCPTRRAKPVRFQRWSVKDGVLESGTVHGAKACRRLITID